jgi:DNA-binding winged helix-turn-helix (wHTH) protein
MRAMGGLAFGVFEFDPETGELRKQGRRVHLAAQPARALALLLARAGEVVTRDELRAHVWGDGTFVEFDRGLNFCISEIRAALNDEARGPRFVETLPRRGYRFIAEVRPVAIAVEPSPLRAASHWRTAAAVVALLAMQLPSGPHAHTRQSARPEALSAFERALSSGDASGAGRRRRIAGLRTATRLDPRFAEAHYALADSYLDAAVRSELPMDSALVEAREAAERAVALEESPEGRQVLGTVRLLADRDWAGARRELARALTLAPKWDSGLVSYARLLSAGRDDAGAITAIDRAEALSPACDLVLFEAGQIYARAGRLTEALEKYRRSIEVGPPRGVTINDWRREVSVRMLVVDVRRRDWRAAQADAAAIMAANGVSESMRQRFLAADPAQVVGVFLQRSAAALEVRAATERDARRRAATIQALLDHDEQAIAWLDRAAAERDPELPYALRNPEFDRLRDQPRYQAIAAAAFTPLAPRP